MSWWPVWEICPLSCGSNNALCVRTFRWLMVKLSIFLNSCLFGRLVPGTLTLQDEDCPTGCLQPLPSLGTTWAEGNHCTHPWPPLLLQGKVSILGTPHRFKKVSMGARHSVALSIYLGLPLPSSRPLPPPPQQPISCLIQEPLLWGNQASGNWLVELTKLITVGTKNRLPYRVRAV